MRYSRSNGRERLFGEERQAQPNRPWAVPGLLVGLLTASNIASNRVLPEALYIPWNLGMAGLLVVIAVRVDGRSLDELGLDRSTLARGAKVGLAIVGLTAATYLLAAVLPGTRSLFDDARVKGSDLDGVLWDALVRVPLGTVVLEEVAFRGVLPAVFAARTSLRRAVGIAAGLFGLWHVLPATNLGHQNPVIEDVLGDAGIVIPISLAVASTAVAGVVLWLLRRWTGSLATPMLAHWSTNGLGYLLAYIIG